MSEDLTLDEKVKPLVVGSKHTDNVVMLLERLRENSGTIYTRPPKDREEPSPFCYLCQKVTDDPHVLSMPDGHTYSVHANYSCQRE